MFGRLQTSQVWFYELPDFGRCLYLWISTDHFLSAERYANRLNIEGLEMFSLGASNAPYTIAAFIKGKKVSRAVDWDSLNPWKFPSRVRLIACEWWLIRIWNQPLEAKAFLISIMWIWNGILKVRRIHIHYENISSRLGSALLVLCSTDMSENSYYGDTMLQYLNRNGDSSNIQLSTSDIDYHHRV